MYRHTQSFPDLSIKPFWERAAAAHISDNGLKAKIEIKPLEIIYEFSLRSEFVSFYTAIPKIELNAQERFKAAHPEPKN